MRLVAVLFSLLLAGCGYHVPGSADSWVGGEARVLYIQLFDNQTAEPYLENFVTDALIAELSKSRLIELTEKPSLADVRLVGEIQSFRSRVLAYGSSDQITDYRATMSISVRLLQENSSDILWQESLQRSEDYLANVNKSLQLQGRNMAAREVSQRLAEDVYAGMLNSF